MRHDTGTVLCVVAVLFAAAFLLYAPVTRNQFIEFDDRQYVPQNAQVLNGLTAEGVRWAFATTQESNWHPLTWISLMHDAPIFGITPASVQLTNVFLHALNAALLFLVFFQMTDELWSPAAVAPVFAIHPLQVAVGCMGVRAQRCAVGAFLLPRIACVSRVIGAARRRPVRLGGSRIRVRIAVEAAARDADRGVAAPRCLAAWKAALDGCRSSEACRSASRRGPNGTAIFRSSASHYNLGTVFSLQGDPRGALAHWRERVCLNPNSARARTFLGRQWMQRGDTAAARVEFEPAARLDPWDTAARAQAYDVEAQFNLAVAALRAGNPAEAQFEEAPTLDPTIAKALEGLATVRHLLGQGAGSH